MADRKYRPSNHLRLGAHRTQSKFSNNLQFVDQMRVIVICAVAVHLAITLPVTYAQAGSATEQRLPACLSCHGENGQSQTSDVPSLGGQPAPYTLIQLFMFRERLRVAAPMNEDTKGWSDEDLQNMSIALSRLSPPSSPEGKGDPQLLARGSALAEQNHCNVCHRSDFTGQENVPRLADQREDYLLKTLREYKTGARHAYDATMAEVLQPVDDNDLGVLAHFLAHAR
jgi:cytochrome c553